MLNSRGGLAIAVLLYYLVAGPFALYVAIRHGFGRQSGWVLLVVLSIIRILGSILELVVQNQPNNVNIIIAATVLSSIGLSPLILAMLGMLKRV